MLIVLILAVVWNLVYAVGVGLIIASFIFMKKMGDLTADKSIVTKLAEETDMEALWPDEKGFPVNLKEEVFIKHLEGPLFFGYTNDFQTLAQEVPHTASHVLIRMDKVPYVDQSGLYALEDVLIEMISKGTTVLLVGVNEQPLLRMKSIDIVPDLVHEEFLFDNFEQCLVHIHENVEDLY